MILIWATNSLGGVSDIGKHQGFLIRQFNLRALKNIVLASITCFTFYGSNEWHMNMNKIYYFKKLRNILCKFHQTPWSERSWLMTQSLSNYRGQISPRHLKSTALKGKFLKITQRFLSHKIVKNAFSFKKAHPYDPAEIWCWWRSWSLLSYKWRLLSTSLGAFRMVALPIFIFYHNSNHHQEQHHCVRFKW